MIARFSSLNVEPGTGGGSERIKLGMLLAFVALATQSSAPTLDEVYARVRALPGVHIKGEMVRPATVAVEFKIAPGGLLWAKYPTTEQFIRNGESTTWMPDRRQYAKEKAERENPAPGGFEALWPGGSRMTPRGEGKAAFFAGQDVWEIPCASRMAPEVSLYVAKQTFLPVGTIASANGMTFEIRYKNVKVGPIAPESFRFVPPKDAKPYVPVDIRAKLPKEGMPMPSFAGKDLEGRKMNLQGLLKGRKGLVVNLWFSACTGCIQELPVLSRLGRELRARGVGFIGVNPIDSPETARRTLKLHDILFPTIAGDDAKKIAEKLGVVAYPVTIVVNGDGKVIASISSFSPPALDSALKKIDY